MTDEFVNKILLLIVDLVLLYFIFLGVDRLPAQFSEELKFVMILFLLAITLIPSLLYWLDVKW